ncbi:MAG: phosphoesterase [Rhodospirillales bacterium]|nr:phosphoesterase [Rhodospirillales bacterium]
MQRTWPLMRIGLVGLAVVLAGALAARLWFELQVAIHRVDIPIAATNSVNGLPLRVAVLGDLHVGHGITDLEVLRRVLHAVVAEHPDLILFVGDYTADIREGIEHLRQPIVSMIKQVSLHAPTYAVLGNYETQTGRQEWLDAFRRAGVVALENAVTTVMVGDAQICVRGLGDYYTGRLRWVDWPEACSTSVKITLTHDPAGAFVRASDGIVFAGHTHCGQVRLPFVGALWVPTSAPRAATCGLYQDADRTLYVTSGVGTSVLPLRLGAPSAWDMVTLKQR